MQTKISLQHKLFAWQYIFGKEAYNATQSAILAEYSPKTAKSQGCRLLTYADVKAEIAGLEAEKQAGIIVDKLQRQRFWARVMLDKASIPCNMGDRLRASELLGKSECDFIEKSINLNADIPTEPKAYKAWLQSELDRLDGSDEVIDSYAKSRPAIATRH